MYTGFYRTDNVLMAGDGDCAPRPKQVVVLPFRQKNGSASAGSKWDVVPGCQRERRRTDLWNATAERAPVFRDFPLRLLLRRSTGAN